MLTAPDCCADGDKDTWKQDCAPLLRGVEELTGEEHAFNSLVHGVHGLDFALAVVPAVRANGDSPTDREGDVVGDGCSAALDRFAVDDGGSEAFVVVFRSRLADVGELVGSALAVMLGKATGGLAFGLFLLCAGPVVDIDVELELLVLRVTF